MQTTSKKLFITFETELGETEKLTISNVKDSITRENVELAANDLIAKNVFFSKSGDFTRFKSAQAITTIVEDL